MIEVLRVGRAITATPGATPFTCGANNKPGVVQELPKGPGGRRGSMPVIGTYKTTALERRKTFAGWESKESGTVSSLTGGGSGSGSGSGSDGRPRDTLNREFIESGVDALRRVRIHLCRIGRSPSEYSFFFRSSFVLRVLTFFSRYEGDLDQMIGRIGIGYFSTLYKGTWRKTHPNH
jgi:abelson tyrosine-protein kinase 1